jgi:hypothetical protein
MFTLEFAVVIILARFATIIGEPSSASSLTPDNCKYSHIGQELDTVRQLLNQETIIRLSLERKLGSMLTEVEELKKNYADTAIVTPNQKTDDAPSKYYNQFYF